MIQNTAAAAAIIVAQEFDKRGLMLDVVPGTPLAQLNSTVSLLAGDINGVKTYEPSVKVISDQSANWHNDECSRDSQHCGVLSTLSADISKYVQSHLNFAKNTVRPLIEELVTEVKADIEALPVSTQYSMEIIVDDLPEPMVVSSFEDAIMEYKEVNYFAIASYLSLPSLTAPEVITYLTTGHSSTDKAISTWVAKKGESFFQHIWDCVFTNTPTDHRFEGLVNDPIIGTDSAVAIYLLATKLFDNPPEGVSLTLGNYNKAVAELRNQAALKLVHVYGEYIRHKTTGLLIKSNLNNKVTVVGDTYRKWMEDGGNNAVIFGCILSNNGSKFVTDINERKVDYMATWERQNVLLTTSERNRRFVYYKEILKNRTLKLVSDNFKQCYSHLRGDEAVTSNMPEYEQFKVCLDEHMYKLTEHDFKNLWSLCQDIICECVFYYTDAGKILTGIENACNENNGIAIREAALLSTIAYVTDYVCDQLKISSL